MKVTVLVMVAVFAVLASGCKKVEPASKKVEPASKKVEPASKKVEPAVK